MGLPKEAEEKVQELQKLEQSMQSFAQQKQTFQAQLNELNSATQEIEKTEKSYKIVGNIMVLRDKEELTTEINQKKEMTELRVKTIEKQEAKLREKVAELQAEVMKAIESAEKKE